MVNQFTKQRKQKQKNKNIFDTVQNNVGEVEYTQQDDAEAEAHIGEIINSSDEELDVENDTQN